MLTHSPAGEELRRFLPVLGGHTMTAMKQDFGAVQTMLKQMPAAKFTAFLKSMACAQQAVAEKTSFASQSLEVHHIADWTSLICVSRVGDLPRWKEETAHLKGHCSARRPNCAPGRGSQGTFPCEWEVQDEVHQARMTAHETRPAKNENCFNTTLNLEPLRPLSHTREKICAV